jgi:hypothetical protein
VFPISSVRDATDHQDGPNSKTDAGKLSLEIVGRIAEFLERHDGTGTIDHHEPHTDQQQYFDPQFKIQRQDAIEIFLPVLLGRV